MSSQRPHIQTKLSFSKSQPTGDSKDLKRKLSEDSVTPGKMSFSSDDTPRASSPVKNFSLFGSGADEGSDQDRDDVQNSSDENERSGDEKYQGPKQISRLNSKNEEKSYGCPIEKLNQVPQCLTDGLPNLRKDVNHSVFFIANQKLKEAKEFPQPVAGEFRDYWDSDDEVKMPCSNNSLTPDPENQNKTKRRWHVIKEALSKYISDNFYLEEAILSYNCHYRNRWNFDALHRYFKQMRKTKPQEYDEFFTTTLPNMTKLALQLPHLFKSSIPFLRQKEEKILTFSQQQVACLLANAFFCTFPRRNMSLRGGFYPDINFSCLFEHSRVDGRRFAAKADQKIEKLKCILHYFKRVTENMPKGVITYSRHQLKENIRWDTVMTKFTKIHLSPVGSIEDVGRKMLQADFANEYVGGGVLGHGCVQEEIRFLICPEMIISRLFTEILMDKEVFVMTGCERFSNYTGYSDTFKWKSNHIDTVERDEWGRLYTEVVAMDALHFKRHMNQFEERHVKRELNKAYMAFEGRGRSSLPAVCTGNWGCGAFGGNSELKVLIQIMAASRANRDICYLSVGNEKLCHEMSKIYTGLLESDMTVSDLYGIIMDYSKSHVGENDTSTSLLEYLAKNISVPLS